MGSQLCGAAGVTLGKSQCLNLSLIICEMGETMLSSYGSCEYQVR